MAVDIKVAPEEKLELVQTLIVDNSANSEYFNISELPDSFSGGKNAFLIAGSDLLQSNSEIKIQIRDAAGNIVYHEFSDGSPNEYYEGNSKVVAVYVYPTETAFGPATITVLGELNIKNVNVPIDWQNKYNVKWTGRVNINPALANTTRVRFKKRPNVKITEILEPLYTVNTITTTYTGSARAIPVSPNAGTNYQNWLNSGHTIDDLYYAFQTSPNTQIISSSLVGSTITTDIPGYSPIIKTAPNTTYAYVYPPLLDSNGNITGSPENTFISYSIVDTTATSKVASLVTQSFAAITINQLETFAGDVARVKVFRTSTGDISDYELIQDIRVESKNLLTTYALSSSVVGNAGLFTQDSLSKVWNTGSLSANLTSTYVNDGVKLAGHGYLTYTSSLNLLSSNTYELQLNSFFTGSTSTNLVAYISGTQNGAIPITTFSGSIPTKNFGTTTTAFKIANDEPSASLYLSQSSGTNQWHIGNISLNLSQDTAFSPNEISFITSMPTVLGNETFNFKFELYDINNNYVPIALTSSVLFNGGNNNIGGTLLIVSGSTSASNASILALSQSVSGTISATSQSVSSSIAATSSSLSSSISQSTFTASIYTSASVSTLSGSVSTSINLVSGSLSSSINVVSGSVVNLSSSVSTSLSTLSSSLSTSLSTISSSVSNSSFTVYSASAYLEKFIFTDENGKLNKTPTTSSVVNGLYLGSTYLGYYSGSSWKTYMDNQGDFYLTGSNNNFLAWNSSLGTLQVQGVINIQGGNAATTSSVSSSINSATSSLSQSLAPNIFTSTTGLINRPPVVLVGGTSGLYLGSSYLGYYDGSDWKTYMANNGNFYLSGPGTNSLSWINGALTINGVINITGGNAATQTYASGTAFTQATTAQSNAVSTAASDATTKANAARTAAELFASGIGTNAVASGSAAATAAQTAAINQAKADASASVTLLANGNWTAGSGTFITSNSISSPVIAGNAGYISSLFKVGQGGITLDGGNKKIFIGTGTFGNANTGFYADNDGNFSLGNQLTFTGGNLAIAGAASIGGTTATTIANGAAAGAAALQPGANISSLNNNSGYQDASSVNSAAKTAGSVGGWTINSTNLTSNNNRTILYNTGYIELKDTAGQNKITIDSSATLPSPTAGSDSGNIVVPAQSAQTVYYQNGTISGGTSPLVGPDGNGFYGIGWSQQVVFTPTISGYYEFTTWFPKNDGMGASGTSGTALMGLRAYIYDMAGNSLINDDGREYIEGPVEGAGANTTQSGYATGTYGNQYNRDGTGAYFSNQYLTAGVAVRFLIQWVIFNIRYSDNLTIKAYWPATNVQFISNVPKTNINQQGFQVIQDTNRYLTIKPSGWYMYNDPAIYGGSPPPYINDQGVTEVTGIMGGTMVVLNATDKGDWHSGKQKQYIRSAQYSFANRAAGGNFLTSFFFGGYGRSFNITRAYGWFTPNSNTGFTTYDSQWWPYAYNIESITRISYGKFQVTFAESVMDSYGAYSGGGIYSVFIGRRDGDYASEFTTAAISNIYHTGFIMDLGNETPANRFVSILVIA